MNDPAAADLKDVEVEAVSTSPTQRYFVYSREDLMQLVEERNLTVFSTRFGGLSGLVKGLHTDAAVGLPLADVAFADENAHLVEQIPDAWQYILSPEEWTSVSHTPHVLSIKKVKKQPKREQPQPPASAVVGDTSKIPDASLLSTPRMPMAVPSPLRGSLNAKSSHYFERRPSRSDLLLGSLKSETRAHRSDMSSMELYREGTHENAGVDGDGDSSSSISNRSSNDSMLSSDRSVPNLVTTPENVVIAIPTNPRELGLPLLVEEQEDDSTDNIDNNGIADNAGRDLSNIALFGESANALDSMRPHSTMTERKVRMAPSPIPNKYDDVVSHADAAGTPSSAASSAHFTIRRRLYGRNMLPPTPSTSLLMLMWQALQDKVLIFLLIAAVVSLAIGIYEDVRQPNPALRVNWVEGFAIFVAVFIVVIVTALNDYQKERQFRKLNAKKEDRLIQVLRSGEATLIHIADLVVGDVLVIAVGDVLPADAIAISTRNLVTDESSMTGESASIRKDPSKNPFLLSGTQVLEGQGLALVIAVGESSLYGKTMMSLRVPSQSTPLQRKLGNLAEIMAKGGLVLALVLLVVLILKYVISSSVNNSFGSGDQIASRIMAIIIQSITIVVVAVPEGMPMAVTLALAYTTMQMLKEQNLVRILASCEIMGGATTICSDKTGTLTLNRMTVVRGWMGGHMFSSPNDDRQQHEGMLAIEQLFIENAVINSTVSEGKDDRGQVALIGNRTEAALLAFSQLLRPAFLPAEMRAKAVICDVVPFNSERKMMTTSVSMVELHQVRVYVKGAAEMILKSCQYYLDNAGQLVALDVSMRELLNNVILEFANDSLRTICLAYRDVPEEEYHGSKHDTIDELQITQNDDNHVNRAMAFEKELIFIAVMAIEDPIRAEVPAAMLACQGAGITVRMVTGDNMITARHIARRCHLLQKGDIIMEGPEFRRLNDDLLARVLPRLRVLARSSPLDKQLLVRKLQKLGEIVAVTGDGTNDAPALKLANVGFSMGVTGTEVAKEASDIVLMDDNFTSIVSAVIWGRNVFDSIRKFLQFLLTMTVSAVALAFVSAIVDSQNDSVLTPIQLLWINIIMDSGAALSLATEPPNREALLHRPPLKKKDSLVSGAMGKMIVIMSIYQLMVCFLLLYTGPLVFQNVPSYPNAGNRDTIRTLVFNAFVWMQMFNEVNCRRVDNSVNVFGGILRNWYFIIIWTFSIGMQVVLVEVGGIVFSTVPLPWFLWLLSIGLGLSVIPMAICVRLFVPDFTTPAWLRAYQAKRRRQRLQRRRARRLTERTKRQERAQKDTTAVIRQQSLLSLGSSHDSPLYLPTDEEILNQESYRWQSAISHVMTQIRVIKALRKDTSG